MLLHQQGCDRDHGDGSKPSTTSSSTSVMQSPASTFAISLLGKYLLDHTTKLTGHPDASFFALKFTKRVESLYGSLVEYCTPFERLGASRPLYDLALGDALCDAASLNIWRTFRELQDGDEVWTCYVACG